MGDIDPTVHVTYHSSGPGDLTYQSSATILPREVPASQVGGTLSTSTIIHMVIAIVLLGSALAALRWVYTHKGKVFDTMNQNIFHIPRPTVSPTTRTVPAALFRSASRTSDISDSATAIAMQVMQKEIHHLPPPPPALIRDRRSLQL
ncbi:hypothetical protein C0991_004571 [Blastosporella zonata]|nr:hypothetical protein C0991_004571 [Blastosporella zonata]